MSARAGVLRAVLALVGGWAGSYAASWAIARFSPLAPSEAVVLSALAGLVVLVLLAVLLLSPLRRARAPLTTASSSGESFTERMAWVHTWWGLWLGWVLYVVFFAGTLSVVHRQISFWMRPELHAVSGARANAARLGQAFLEREAPGASGYFITLPTERQPFIEASWDDAAGESHTAALDTETGARIDARETEGGELFFRLHYSLHAGDVGIWLVGAAAVGMLIALISGVVIHLKRLVRELFVFRPRAARARAWLDAHVVASVLALPFHLMIAFTGLVIFYWEFMPGGIAARYAGSERAFRADVLKLERAVEQKRPAALVDLQSLVARAEDEMGPDSAWIVGVEHPGDAGARVTVHRRTEDRISQQLERVTFDGATGTRVSAARIERPWARAQSFLAGLHLIDFGGAPLRWLYFVSGALGCAMIGSGLALFEVKRRRKYAAAGAGRGFWKLTQSLNVAVVAGLACASGAYFVGNRVIPAGIGGRAAVEQGCFWIAWAGCAAHAALRPYLRAFREQLACGAALFLAIPLLDVTLGAARIWAALRGGQSMAYGLDLAALGASAVLFAVSLRIEPAPRRDARPALTSRGALG